MYKMALSINLGKKPKEAHKVLLCYIPHQYSNFYACLDKDQLFANLKDDDIYFNDW